MTREHAIDSIKDYLTAGGLINPEYMDHDAVRDLILECRDALEASEAARAKAEQERDALKEALKPFVVGDEAMANILWGDLPDCASMKITTPLGAVRAARRALEASK